MHLSELKALHVSQLIEMATGLDIEGPQRMRKQELMFAILKRKAKTGETIFGDGVLEVLPDGFGFLRSPETSYLASTDDIYISPSQIRRFNLHTGDTIEGEVRTPKEGERYFALVKVDKINGEPPEASKNKILFENLTPLHPDRVMTLERNIEAKENITGRIIDMIAPIGAGQRGLIVAPPKAGKTVLMQHIAHAITTNHPEVTLIVLLIDERPEEVTEMSRSVRGEVVASTFDEPATRHVQVAEMVIEKAKRLVEHKRDVVILLDSITRLARAYNTVVPASGKVLTGGVDANALQRPKRFFAGAQHRGRRLADHHRHRADRYRQPDGRGDLRGVQGHRQHGAAPGPPDDGEAGLPRHQHLALGHPPRGAADQAGSPAEDLDPAQAAARHGRNRCDGVPARQDAADEEQPGLLRHDEAGRMISPYNPRLG
jgi:transcription termination factor Rho